MKIEMPDERKHRSPEKPPFSGLKFAGKNRYSFRLATTSFIYRAGYIENVQLLGPHFDEIELLFFESRSPGSYPTTELIDNLRTLGAEHAITFNVHLPIDISPGDSKVESRQHALRVLLQYIRLTLPLAPASFTLHLPYSLKDIEIRTIHKWQGFLIEILSEILASNVDPDLICVENLDYPFEWVMDLIDQFQLKICFDIGHMLVQQQAPGPFFRRHRDRIGLMHLHGVRDGRDHLALDTLDPSNRTAVLQLLQAYTGTVSLEVFSHSDLQRSLAFLAESGLAQTM